MAAATAARATHRSAAPMGRTTASSFTDVKYRGHFAGVLLHESVCKKGGNLVFEVWQTYEVGRKVRAVLVFESALGSCKTPF